MHSLVIGAVFGLSVIWLVAEEIWRHGAPAKLVVFIFVPWMAMAIAWCSVLRGKGAPFRLAASLILVDGVLDLLDPYPQHFAFLRWELVRIVAVLLAGMIATRVSFPRIARALRGFSLATAIAIPATMLYVGLRGVHDETRPADAALVLGFALDGHGEAQPQLVGRVEHAVDLYRRGLVPRLVVTGGLPRSGRTEGSVMRELAIAGGVPQEAIVVEESARSTIQNFACSRPLLEKLGARHILVVTEPFHMPRAMLLARRHHVEASPSPAFSETWRSPGRAAYWLFRDASGFLFETLRNPVAAPGKCDGSVL